MNYKTLDVKILFYKRFKCINLTKNLKKINKTQLLGKLMSFILNGTPKISETYSKHD